MNNQTQSGVAFASADTLVSSMDAAILVGASCGGEAEYKMIAEELGYGPLAMPYPCDTQTIKIQLEAALQ